MPKRREGICEIEYVDKDKVNALKRQMLNDEGINRLSEVFGVLSDTARAKIVFTLSKKELCVCDMASLLNLSISAVSHQLRALRNMRLVKYRKQGRVVFYSLDEKHILTLFHEGLKHIRESIITEIQRDGCGG